MQDEQIVLSGEETPFRDPDRVRMATVLAEVFRRDPGNRKGKTLLRELHALFEETAKDPASTRVICAGCGTGFAELGAMRFDLCPYCGVPVTRPEMSAPVAPINVDSLHAAIASMSLEGRANAVHELHEGIKSRAWELGLALHFIQERELWKGGQYRTFQEFYESRGIPRSTAYALARVSSKYSQADFLEFGRAKLMLVEETEPDRRAPVESAMRAGASKREMEAMRKGAAVDASQRQSRAAEDGEIVDDQEDEDVKVPKVDRGQASIVARVALDESFKIPLRRLETGDVATQVSYQNLDKHYAEVKLTKDTSLQIWFGTEADGTVVPMGVYRTSARREDD